MYSSAEKCDVESSTVGDGRVLAPRLDMSHGSIRNIVYQQVLRDEYDKLVKTKTETVSAPRNSRKPKNNKLEQNLYKPPHMRTSAAAPGSSLSQQNKAGHKNPWMAIAGEDSRERLAIRKRLERAMEREKTAQEQIIKSATDNNNIELSPKTNIDLPRRNSAPIIESLKQTRCSESESKAEMHSIPNLQEALQALAM